MLSEFMTIYEIIGSCYLPYQVWEIIKQHSMLGFITLDHVVKYQGRMNYIAPTILEYQYNGVLIFGNNISTFNLN